MKDPEFFKYLLDFYPITEKIYSLTLSAIIALILLVPVSVLNSGAACITYSSSTKTITISCTAPTRLTDVNTELNNPAILKKASNGEWLLAANLLIAKNANGLIDSSDTTWVKIISDGVTGFGIKNQGTLKIDSVKITSWNTATNTYASPGSGGASPRGYIVAQGGATGKMDILDSEIAYLGYDGTGHHGLDYYDSDNSLIQNNHIHHNWRAFYSSEVGGIRIDHNNVHDNLEYGIDPHSGTHDMYITFNKSYNNNHGIICSQRCYNLHIENNEVYANNRDGIYLDAGTHHSTITNNIIYQEETAIQLPSLSYSEVYGNTISDSKYGIKLYTQLGSAYETNGGCGTMGCGSTNNNIHDNKITASSTGIEVRDGASSNTFESNTINGASTGRAIVVEDSISTANIFKTNKISSAATGMKVTVSNKESKFVGNEFTTVASSGEYALEQSSALKLENTVFSSDVIRVLDSTSIPVSISSSGVISVTDGATGAKSQFDTNANPYSRTLGANGKITVTTVSSGPPPPTDTTPPTVASTNPSDGATGVAVASSVTATFSEPVQSSTVTSSSFTLKQGTTSIQGAVSLSSDGKTATFNPSSSLADSTTFTAAITTAVKDTAGNAMTGTKSWSFTTATVAPPSDTTPPIVVSTNPSDDATGVGLSSSVTATFSEPVQSSTVTSSSFTLKQGTTSIQGAVSLSSDGKTATFNPSSSLADSTTFTAAITTAVKDTAGNSMGSAKTWSFTTAAVAPPTDTTPPAQVTGLAVTVQSSTQLNLGWNANTELDFNHYNVYRGTSSGFTVNPGVTQPLGTSTTESYSSTGLNPSTTYYYKVAAVDDAGNVGAVSAEKSATTHSNNNDNDPPSKVSGLSVKTISDTQIDLKWSSVKDSDLHHYNIYRGTSSSFTVKAGDTQPIGTSTTSSYSNTGLTPSTTYYYKVAAVDDAGNVGSVSSSKSGKTHDSQDSTSPSNKPPSKVSRLSVKTISDTQIDLKWSSVKDSDLHHYNIYRGTSSSFTVKAGDPQPIGTSTSNSYHSNGLNPSTKYYYRVAAVDDAGNVGSVSSSKSGKTHDRDDSESHSLVHELTNEKIERDASKDAKPIIQSQEQIQINQVIQESSSPSENPSAP